MLAGWAALALATLTKGLVAVVLPAATVVVYSVWQRDWKLWTKLHLFKGLLLFLLIAAPWFIAVSIANPEFAHFFFIHEHFDRYTSDVHNREGPLYYFIPYLLLGLCPWLVTSLRTLVKPGFKWRPGNPGVFNPERFMWTFVVVTFCFFSLGQSKLPGYILPILPIIAVLSGGRLEDKGGITADRWVMLGLGLVLLLVAFNLEQFASERYPAWEWASYAPWLIGGGILFLLSSGVLFVQKNVRLPAVAIAAILSLGATLSIVSGANTLSESRSSRVVADVLAKSLPAGAPVFSFLNYPEAAVFYLGRPITVVEYEGELAMGIGLEPEKHISTQDELIAIWQNLDQAAVVVKVNRLKSLDLEALQGRVIYQGPKFIVIIKS